MSTLAASATPPAAAKIVHVHEYHGEKVEDPYHWLKEKTNADVIAHLDAENAYVDAMTAHLAPLQDTLYGEYLARIKQTDDSVPYRQGAWYYYHRTEEGKQYKIRARKPVAADGRMDTAADEVVVLDENVLAEGHAFSMLGAFKPSPDGNILAYAVDQTGDEKNTVRFRDMRTGEDLPDAIPNTYYDLEWADNKTVFYTVLSADTHRPYRVYRHVLGEDAADDVVCMEEPDERFELTLSTTMDGRFVLASADSQVTTEMRLLDVSQPLGDFVAIRPREQDVEYSVEVHGEWLYMLTNGDGCTNFKMQRAPLGELLQGGAVCWEDVMPYDAAVKLDSVLSFKDFLAVIERRDGLRQIRVQSVHTGDTHYVEFPEPAYTCRPCYNREYDTDKIRFEYSSMVTPKSVFDHDMSARSRGEPLKVEPVLGYNKDEYVTERIWVTVRDGTRVPISLVSRKGTPRDGSAPCLLAAYGSYGISYDPAFRSSRISLLDRGVVYAVAHVRGGGELGREWYHAGRRMAKKNTFFDVIDCAQHLVREGITSSEHLVLTGRSAGGLMVGAVLNLAPPGLFKGAVAGVPFVDVIATLDDESLPLTVIEYEEWGNSKYDKEAFDYIRSYSPVDNVTAREYPNLLSLSGLNDPRVGYWEPTKWTAKLRELKTDDNVLLLKTQMAAGHFSCSGRYDHLKEDAFEMAVTLDWLGAAGK